MKKIVLLLTLFGLSFSLLMAQEYYFGKYAPFDVDIKSPEVFLGYPIGSHHTRHDQLVDYFEYLADISKKAQIEVYGETHEKRPLIILTISEPDHLDKLQELREVLDKDSQSPEAASEFGDLLFSMVNLARSIQVHPETALWKATSKFVRRFRFVEERLKQEGASVESASLAEMDRIWEESKKKLDL
jgi:NTP pyrophosphatase (non-canonical NTP hydrolase)